MVIRCGDHAWEANTGSWVQFPAGVPHTFRVLDGPARVLLVHADDSFLAAVRRIGRPADTDKPATAPGPSAEALDRAFADHGITNVGPPLEYDEAQRIAAGLAAGAGR